jgi:RimJ/RimL family protein N-acetyltransferase
MNIQNKFGKARVLLSRHGLRGLVIYLSRLLFFGGCDDKSCRIFLFELSTPRPTPESIRASEGHTFRFATIEDIRTYHTDPLWDISGRDILAFERGDRCLLQLDGNTLVGYAWLAVSSLVELTWGFHFNMPDDTVYNYKGFTAPAYRGKGFQPLRHLRLLEHVRGMGQRRLFSYVEQMNLSSLKGLKKSGYRKIGVLRCVRKQKKARFFLKVSDGLWSRERRT